MLSLVFKSCWNIFVMPNASLCVCVMTVHMHMWNGLEMWILCDHKQKGQKPTDGNRKGKYVFPLCLPYLCKSLRSRNPIWLNSWLDSWGGHQNDDDDDDTTLYLQYRALCFPKRSPFIIISWWHICTQEILFPEMVGVIVFYLLMLLPSLIIDLYLKKHSEKLRVSRREFR